MVHKIHMGAGLPSVGAGKPYMIGSADFSHAVFPADARRCEVCHAADSGAKQADAWITHPSRDACGSCHDDVSFATGQNHSNLPQVSDNSCTNCHIKQGEVEFDASIIGAHMISTESKSPPAVVDLVEVTNAGPARIRS
jgi:OmcA/MtrC family decaheme c-type cytochrome